jgi:hypothetical protein
MTIVKTTTEEFSAEIDRVRAELDLRGNIEGEVNFRETHAKARQAQLEENYTELARLNSALTFWAQYCAIRHARAAFDCGQFIPAYRFYDYALTGKGSVTREILIESALAVAASL